MGGLCLRTRAFNKPPVTVHGETVPVFFPAARPTYGQASDLLGLAQSEEVPSITRREVAAAPVGETVLAPAVHLQSHLGPDHIAVLPAHQLDAQPVTLRHDLVAQKRYGFVNIADDQIGAAVVIEVAQRDAPAVVFAVEIGTAPGGDRLEAPPPLLWRITGFC